MSDFQVFWICTAVILCVFFIADSISIKIVWSNESNPEKENNEVP
jgi:hypothetical protein